MKLFKIIPALVLVCLNIQFAFAQEISKEDRKQIKTQEEEIQANEDMLVSGVKGLTRIKSRLEKDKSKKRISQAEVERKEKIIRNVESRLSSLENKITKQKQELRDFKKSLKITVEEKTDIEVAEKVVIEDETASDIKEREEKLELAKQKLAQQIKESEEAFKRQQEALRKKNEELSKLDNKLKAEKKAIQDKLTEENRQKIMEYEDDISVNEEMLISGREGLKRKKEKLEAAKNDGSLTKESIARRSSVIERIEKRLNKIEREIETKKEAIKKLKGA
jgi:chromosome segregation ATPase